MPLYYFHLGIGGRILRDDEGIELPDRAAARREANAIIHELAPRMAEGRWGGSANWFLRVADADGQFLHLPTNGAGLELVANGAISVQRQAPDPRDALDGLATASELAVASYLIIRVSAARRRSAQLVEQNRQLRLALASALDAIQSTRAQTSRLLGHGENQNTWRDG